jgi:polyisoprenoid-binding protein YceI
VLTLALVPTHAAVGAEPALLTLDPDATAITFSLDTTLHRVHGSLHLLRGTIGFDPVGGPASGLVVLSAQSAATGNSLRDHQMHQKVLMSEQNPEIAFVPTALRVDPTHGLQGEVSLAGRVRILGEEHPVTIPAQVEVDNARVRIDGKLRAPYVEWGLRDMSALFLHVDPVVELEIHATGSMDPPYSGAAATP